MNTTRTQKEKVILITGATGMIGQSIVEYFVRRRHIVRVFARTVETHFVRSKYIQIYAGDICVPDDVISATKNVFAVVHLAGAKSDEVNSEQINIEGARNLLSACKKNNVRRIINVSTLSTKIQEKGVYGRTKLAADRLFIGSSIPTITLKLSLVYTTELRGLFQTISRATRWKFVPVFGTGETPFAPVAVSDLAAGIESLVFAKTFVSKVYDVGGPFKISFSDLTAMIAELQDRDVAIIPLPVWLGLFIATVCSWFFPVPPITRSNVLGGSQRVEIDTNTFWKKTGVTPSDLKVGLRTMLKPKTYTLEDEARLLFSYILQQHRTVGVKKDDCSSYQKIMRQHNQTTVVIDSMLFEHPWLIGVVEAYQQLFRILSPFRFKVRVAATLIECNSVSAEHLLPRKMSVPQFVAALVRISFTSGVKVLTGMSLQFLPRIRRIHVENF